MRAGIAVSERHPSLKQSETNHIPHLASFGLFLSPMEPSSHILLVEDDREISSLVSRFLRSNDFRVSTAGDGRGMGRALKDARRCNSGTEVGDFRIPHVTWPASRDQRVLVLEPAPGTAIEHPLLDGSSTSKANRRG